MNKYCKKCGFPCTLQAVLGSHGIVVKCTAVIFFSYGGLLLCFHLSFSSFKSKIELEIQPVCGRSRISIKLRHVAANQKKKQILSCFASSRIQKMIPDIRCYRFYQ